MSDIFSEAKRCLQCKNPSCVKGCPLSTDIPKVIKLFLDKQISEAGRILFENNPLSAICSSICPHKANCMGHCVLNRQKNGIEFHAIENYISKFYLEKTRFKPNEKNGHMVGIIGAGPAGLTLAILLAQRGFDVTIFDSKDKIGGVLRYGIPDFRLPKSILDTLLQRMNGLGIAFRPNTLIGPTITIDDMFNDGYEAIFIGIGVWKPNRLRIPGETLGNVHFAIDYLKNPDSYDNLGDNVVIIGAGNVAMDAARTILRKTNAKVNIIFNRGEDLVTALNEELRLALVDGVNINYYLNTIKIEKDGIIVEPVIEKLDEDGNKVFINDIKNPYKIPSTSVIISIGQGAQANIVKNTEGNINTTNKGLIAATTNGITNRDGVFAAGDVVSGARTVVEAVAATKLVAMEIEKYILSNKRSN